MQLHNLFLLLLSPQAAEERHTAAIAALKSGWAAELKRQQAGWESGAAAKQEAWRAAKTAEIKEQTVKVCVLYAAAMVHSHTVQGPTYRLRWECFEVQWLRFLVFDGQSCCWICLYSQLGMKTDSSSPEL
jgi:hypothetical protein